MKQGVKIKNGFESKLQKLMGDYSSGEAKFLGGPSTFLHVDIVVALL